MSERALREILDSLSPSVLLETVFLPFDEWREDFAPRFLSTSSYEAMIDEAARFVCHVYERWFHYAEWPHERGLDAARRLINRELGDGSHPKSGEFVAMRACREGDRGGLRMVLDALASGLQAEALGKYVSNVVMPRIAELDADASLKLAEAYLEEFESLPGLELESPASIAATWHQVIHQHAHVVNSGYQR